ncbi:site-specific integrase [Roseovarius spongiae]|uniref:Site-specific integrase n=2 Tax=Roseovarius spongiae TaxID=2320272 RepID=A0A3A8B794_9RHOB|nr:site-specific integrase [Roseovarius spongiae]
MHDSPRLKTLNDVRLLLPTVYSEASARTLDAALRKAEKLTGRKLSQLPADENAWYSEFRKIVWAGAFRGATPGDQQTAFEIWGKKIAATIRRTQAHLAQPIVVADESTAWDQIVDYAAGVENTVDGEGIRILPNMFSLSMITLRSQCRSLHPGALTTDTAFAALAKCRADKVTSLRNAIRAFNRLIREQNRHGAIAHLLPNAPIGPLPLLRDAALDWSRFTDDFLASRDRAIARAVQPDRKARRDRFDGRLGKSKLGSAGARKGRWRKIRNPDAARKAHLNALSWLIRHAFPDREVAYAFERIEDLFTPAIATRAVDAYIARARASETLIDPNETASAATILSRLQVLAERNGWDEDIVFELEDARFDRVDSYQTREMSQERAQFVKLVQRDPSVARAIVSGPRRLAGEAQLVFDDWDGFRTREREEALHLSMGACLLALQLARAVRSKNLNGLLIDGPDAELVRPLRDAKPWLDIHRGRVKNRRPIEGEIPERHWKVIVAWLDQGLPKWCAKHGIDFNDNELLLPGPAGVLSRQMYNRIWNRCVDRLGVPGLQPHMMRHVAATIWLAANPGDYATVAAFLCDKISTVEKFYARGEGAAAARLFAEALEALDPTLRSFLKRG